MEIVKSKTARGFANFEFDDRYGARCSIQKSSLATEDAIWFGVNDADPQIMISGVGWKPYPIPKEVLLTTSMHLTRDQVEKILPVLEKFVETGELV